MSHLQLGEQPNINAKRDAVHVAVAPVMSPNPLQPGDRVVVSSGIALPCGPNGRGDGVIDPFLRHPIPPFTRVLVLLNPGSVQNLRHDWDHPSFPAPEPEVEAEPEYDGCRGC